MNEAAMQTYINILISYMAPVKFRTSILLFFDTCLYKEAMQLNSILLSSIFRVGEQSKIFGIMTF